MLSRVPDMENPVESDAGGCCGNGAALGEVELSEESGDRAKVIYPKAQSRPEDTAGLKQQRRTAWIFAIGILVAFLAVSSLLMR